MCCACLDTREHSIHTYFFFNYKKRNAQRMQNVNKADKLRTSFPALKSNVIIWSSRTEENNAVDENTVCVIKRKQRSATLNSICLFNVAGPMGCVTRRTTFWSKFIYLNFFHCVWQTVAPITGTNNWIEWRDSITHRKTTFTDEKRSKWL